MHHNSHDRESERTPPGGGEQAAGAANPETVSESIAAPAGRPRRLIADTHAVLGPFGLALLSIGLGVVTGAGAFAFRLLIAFVHNLAFLGRLTLQYNTNVHTPASPWGAAVVLVPVAGAIVVTFLVQRFAPEAKGHGVPEVMDAIYYHKSEIRSVVAAIKSVASAISIGTGGSVGREGPIIQIGAALASSCGRLFHVSRWQRATLVAAGGGAGIAATFNTPIGGVLFAVEVLLHEVSVRTLVPVALTTATATFVGRALFGDTPAFPISLVPFSGSGSVAVLPAAVVLGALMALVSVGFIRSLYAAEDLFEKHIPRSETVRHVAGMLLVGVVFWLLMIWQGHYYVEGVGYSTVMDVLTGAATSSVLLALLAACKLLVTCLTLGSGGSGGIFSPSLFMGAAIGGAYGFALRAAVPSLSVDPRIFALVGMAGLVAGATGAALTAVVMLFEMTLDYSVILPLTLAAAVSYGLRRFVLPESIYTMKLSRRGHAMPGALQANAHLVHHVGDIVLTGVAVLPAHAGPERLGSCEGAPDYFVLVEDGGVAGILSREWTECHSDRVERAADLAEIARKDLVVVPSDATVFGLLHALQSARASIAVVVDAEGDAATRSRNVLGIITKAHLAEALAEGMELFAD